MVRFIRLVWWLAGLGALAAGVGATRIAMAAGPVIQPVETLRIQDEPADGDTGRYDWGPSVMNDEGLYRMWWVRLGGANEKRFAYRTTLADGQPFEFTYPDYGDRIYYAESRDGRTWHITGDDDAGPPESCGLDAGGPCLVLAPAESAQERNHVGCPSVIRVRDTFYMYYEAPSHFICGRGDDGQVRVLGEYHNQIFLATSQDGKRWRKHPSDTDPQPILTAPAWNSRPGAQRYGIGQPSVFFADGRFVMHCVDSCTGPGDFQVRVEADNPFFRNARVFPTFLATITGQQGVPAGAVARFAQSQVAYLRPWLFLIRPAYGTGRLGLLASQTGLFPQDAAARTPGEVFPQIAAIDTRGPRFGERLFPRFVTDPTGQIHVVDGRATIFYSSGQGFKEYAHTWDLFRCDVRAGDLMIAARLAP